MQIQNLQKAWNKLSLVDPLYAICSDPLKKGNKWDIDEFFQTGIEEAGLLVEDIVSRNGSFSKKKVLDFGCGAGRVTQGLCKYFDSVIGVDIAPNMIRLAKKYNRYGGRCKYLVHSEDNLSLFKDSTFGLIYSTQTLQHIPPKISKKYIKEFIRLLVPNGVVVFNIPSHPKITFKGMILKYVPNFLLNIYRKKMHGGVMELHWVKKEEVIKLLQAFSLEVIPVKNESKDLVFYQYIVKKIA